MKNQNSSYILTLTSLWLSDEFATACGRFQVDENWREISDKEGRGCFLEVDLQYPKKLHSAWRRQNWYSTSQFILGCQSLICQRPWCLISIMITSRKWIQGKSVVHRHWQSLLWNRNRRCLQRYFTWCPRKNRHFKFLTKPFFRHSNRNQQEGSWNVQKWGWWWNNHRVCCLASEALRNQETRWWRRKKV